MLTETNSEQSFRLSLTDDIEQNSIKLMTIPDLDKTVALSVGNAIFIPKNEDCKNSKYNSCVVDIDGTPHILISPENQKENVSRNVYPAMAFNVDAIGYLFRYGGVPIEFKKTFLALAVHKKDENILKMGLNV